MISPAAYQVIPAAFIRSQTFVPSGSVWLMTSFVGHHLGAVAGDRHQRRICRAAATRPCAVRFAFVSLTRSGPRLEEHRVGRDGFVLDGGDRSGQRQDEQAGEEERDEAAGGE